MYTVNVSADKSLHPAKIIYCCCLNLIIVADNRISTLYWTGGRLPCLSLYQDWQHKKNRKKMKALMFCIFLSQYLVHARPQNSFDFLGTFPETARRSFTNINQKREQNSANTVHSKKILSTDREEFFKSFYSNISL